MMLIRLLKWVLKISLGISISMVKYIGNKFNIKSMISQAELFEKIKNKL